MRPGTTSWRPSTGMSCGRLSESLRGDLASKEFSQRIADHPRHKGVAMKRAALSMFLVLVAAALSGTLAGAQPTQADSAQAAPKKQKALIGFYRNRTVN